MPTTITGLPLVVQADLDDTAVLPIDDRNAATRRATIAQLRLALEPGFRVQWADVQATPDTIEEYGITNVYNKTQSDARYAPVVTNVDIVFRKDSATLTDGGTLDSPNLVLRAYYDSNATVGAVTATGRDMKIRNIMSPNGDYRLAFVQGGNVEMASMDAGSGATTFYFRTFIQIPAGPTAELLRLRTITASAEGDTIRLNFSNRVALDNTDRIIASVYAFAESVASDHRGGLVFATAPTAGQLIERVRINAAGNIGISTTDIESWGSGRFGLQLGGSAAIAPAAGSGSIDYLNNAYVDAGGFKYRTAAAASSYRQTLGTHEFLVAPSGTENGPLAFVPALTITNSGAIQVGQGNLEIHKNAANTATLRWITPGKQWKWRGNEDDTFVLVNEPAVGGAETTIFAIQTDGKFKIGGGAAPTDKLEVDGEVRSMGSDLRGFVVRTTGGIEGRLRAHDAGGWAGVGTWSSHNFIILTASMERLRISPSGNLGFNGLNPSNWHSEVKAIEWHQTAISGGTAGNNLYLFSNGYYSATGDVYRANAPAAKYELFNGTHVFRVAPSGTATGAIPWTTGLYIDNAGVVQVKSHLYFLENTAYIGLINNGGAIVWMQNGFFAPYTDNVHNLGGGTHRWKTVFAVTTSINGSARHLKNADWNAPLDPERGLEAVLDFRIYEGHYKCQPEMRRFFPVLDEIPVWLHPDDSGENWIESTQVSMNTLAIQALHRREDRLERALRIILEENDGTLAGRDEALAALAN